VTLLHGIPLLIAVSILSNLITKKNSIRTPLDRIAVFTVLIVSNLILVTSVFTALASFNRELPFFLYTRYYFFTFPFFLIISAATMYEKSARLDRFSRIFLILQLGISFYVVFVTAYFFVYLETDWVNNPEILAIQGNLTICIAFSLVSLFALGLCYWQVDFGAKTYFFLLMPLLIVLALIHCDYSVNKVPHFSTRAGLFARDYLPTEDHDRLAIVAGDPKNVKYMHDVAPQRLFSAAFQVDSSGVAIVCDLPMCPYSSFPQSTKWVLFVGGEPPPAGLYSEMLPMDKFALARIGDSFSIDFGLPAWPGVVNRTKGFSGPANRGGRNVAEKLEIEFVAPLPAKFEAAILARSRGERADRPFAAKVGDMTLFFNLKDDRDERVVLRFDNPARANVLSVEIPFSQPQESAEVSPDGTRSVLELMKLEIKPLI
jgi:hypothetical protein